MRRNRFTHSQWAGGTILLVCALVAFLLANLDATRELYHRFWQQKVTLGVEGFGLSNRTVEEWINDGLMVVFFFAVGLEIKREIIAGQLSTLKQAGLPIAAAVGGMLFPALIYLAFNIGGPAESGWGIPTATDIAFALGVLSLLGDRVPLSMKVFLTALAIVDDLGAILLIALFYSSHIDWGMLTAAAVTFSFLFMLNRLKVYRMKYYILPSLLLWILFLHSGIHATIAGVIVAMTIPSTPRYSKKYFIYKVKNLYKAFVYEDRKEVEVLGNEKQHEYLQAIRLISRNAISPSQRLEYALHPTVTFFIMPLFALANAGVEIDTARLGTLVSAQSLGIFFGLILGKLLSIFLLSRFTVRLGWCVKPAGISWMTFLAVACLGGIGFTMSIFIDTLAFDDPAMVSTGKAAILLASFTAGFIGWLMITLASKLKTHPR